MPRPPRSTPPPWTRAEIHAALDELLDRWRQDMRQGERFFSVNYDSIGQVTSVKGCDSPPAFKALDRPRLTSGGRRA